MRNLNNSVMARYDYYQYFKKKDGAIFMGKRFPTIVLTGF